MLLYYITDRSQFPGSEAERRRALLDRIAQAARAGVDFIQLREKDLPTRALESLARDAVFLVHSNSKLETRNSKLLINHRTDLALATGADGVHLRSDDLPASDARAVAARGSPLAPRDFLVAVSCHSAEEVALAESHGADFAVFAPVFEKSGVPGAGLKALRLVSGHAGIPVLALGGVTLDNARSCLEAGAAGLAAIRLFQQGDLAETVRRLRALD